MTELLREAVELPQEVGAVLAGSLSHSLNRVVDQTAEVDQEALRRGWPQR